MAGDIVKIPFFLLLVSCSFQWNHESLAFHRTRTGHLSSSELFNHGVHCLCNWMFTRLSNIPCTCTRNEQQAVSLRETRGPFYTCQLCVFLCVFLCHHEQSSCKAADWEFRVGPVSCFLPHSWSCQLFYCEMLWNSTRNAKPGMCPPRDKIHLQYQCSFRSVQLPIYPQPWSKCRNDREWHTFGRWPSCWCHPPGEFRSVPNDIDILVGTR